LNSHGNLLGEQLIVPQKDGGIAISHFQDCVRWGMAWPIVGDVTRIVRATSSSGAKIAFAFLLGSDG